MLLLAVLLACSGAESPPPPPPPAHPAASPQQLRVGWQTTWATQGQLALILQKTDILDNLGFAPEFVGFTYGGPLNEGALAGDVDVIFTAAQSAITLMNRSQDWSTVGRLMYSRVGTFVPLDSPAQTPADLRGKTVASGVVTSVVVMRDGYVSEHPGADVRLMEAMFVAYDYYRTHRVQADGWFLEAAGLSFDPEALTLAASVEPNLSVEERGDIRVALSDEDLQHMQQAADFMQQAGLLKAPFEVAPRVRRQVAEKVGRADAMVPKVIR